MLMKQKYIKLSSTVGVLTCLLVVAVFILGKGAFKGNYILAGILFSTLGFSLSWFMKDEQSKIRQILVNFGCTGAILLGTYKILKSSFLAEDILFLVLESVLIMQVIISFNSYSPRNFKSIQILSLVTFMLFPLFIDTLNWRYLTVSILYFFIWGLIIKIQILSKNKKLAFSAWPSYLIYLLGLSLILASTNILSKNIVFNVAPVKGYFLKTKKFVTVSTIFDLQASLFDTIVTLVEKSPENRKKIMHNATSLFQESLSIVEFEKANSVVGSFLAKHGPANIPGIHGTPGDDGLVDPLRRPGAGLEPIGNEKGSQQKKKKKRHGPANVPGIHGTPGDDGLVDPLRRPGAGLEPIGNEKDSEQKKKEKRTEPNKNENNESVSTLRKFIDLKADLKNKIASGRIRDKIASRDKTLKTKIKTSLSLNNIQRATTQKTMDQGIDSLNKNIKALPLNDRAKEQLDEMISNLKTWKLYSIYNNLRNSLKDNLRNADKNETVAGSSKAYAKSQGLEKVFDFIRKIEKALTASEISELYKKMESIEDSLDRACPTQKDDFKKNLDAILKAKMELNLMSDTSKLDKELAGKDTSGDINKTSNLSDRLKKILKKYKTMLSAPEIEEFLEAIKEFQRQIETNDEALKFFENKNWQEITNSKINMFDSKEREEIKNTLNEGLLSKQDAKKFIKSVDDSPSQNQLDNSRREREASEKIQSFLRQGLITKDTASKLDKHLLNLSKITEAKDIVQKLAEKIKKRSFGNRNKELEKTDKLSILNNKELKKDFDSLLEKMISSSSKQEIALLKKKLEDTLKKIKPDEASSSEIKKIKNKLNKLKEIKDKSLLAETILPLINNLNALKSKAEEDERQAIEEVVNSLEQNYLKGETPNENLIKKLEGIVDKAELASGSSSEKKPSKEFDPALRSWQIVIFPKKLVLIKGEKTNLKVIGLYDNSIIKDLTGEVSWTFENFFIARIDSEGTINAISTGQTKAVAAYGSSKSYSVEIIVLEPLTMK